MRPLLLLIALLAATLFFVGHHLEISWLRLLCKPLPVICMLVWLLQAPASAYRRWIIIGLGLSLIGDLLLEWPADLFIFGLGAFLLAHLAYLLAYLGDTRRLAPLDLLIATLASGGMFLVLSRTGLGPLLLPVALYSLAIGLMLWRALARVGVVAGASAWLAAGGAALFVLSDSLIGINRFVAPFEEARYLIMISYWLGQFGIAASVMALHAAGPVRGATTTD